MLRLPRHFILPGTFTAAFLVGACNAVDAPRERARWFDKYITHRDPRNEAVEGFDKARAPVKVHGRQARDRGDHIAGRGADRELKDYRPHTCERQKKSLDSSVKAT